MTKELNPQISVLCSYIKLGRAHLHASIYITVRCTEPFQHSVITLQICSNYDRVSVSINDNFIQAHHRQPVVDVTQVSLSRCSSPCQTHTANYPPYCIPVQSNPGREVLRYTSRPHNMHFPYVSMCFT